MYSAVLNLSLLLLMSIRKCSTIIEILRLALGISILSNTLDDTLSPPRFQIEWLKICTEK